MSLVKTFIGSVGNHGYDPGALALPSYNQPAGELIVVFSEIYRGGGVGETKPTDTAGNNYVALIPDNAGAGYGFGYSYFQVWYAENCLGSATNVIQQNPLYPSYSNYAGFAGWHASGVALSGSADTYSEAYPYAANVGSSGAYTTTQADEVLFSVVAPQGLVYGIKTPQVGWDDDTVGISDVLSCASLIVSSVQVAQTMTWANDPSDPRSLAIVVATFKAATGPSTYSIGGNAGVAGATVAYSGTASGSVTADGSGNYSITGLVNGSYTITPSKTGYTFAPTSAPETVSGSNITGVNFVATPAATNAVTSVSTFWMS